MKADLVDPTRYLPEEIEDSIYRVRIWTRPADSAMSWFVDEWELSGDLDVSEVIAWAQERSPEETFELFLVVQGNAGTGERERLVRLQGHPWDTATEERVEFSRE